MDQPLAVADRDVGSVAFSPDGKTLALGCTRIVGIIGAISIHDGGVVLWDVARREPLVDQPLAVAECGRRSVVFSPDGKTLAAGGDGGVVLWDAARREPLVDQPLAVDKGGGRSVAFSPDGKTLAAGGDGWVVLWNIDLTSWRRYAGAIANRNLSRAEWQEYFPGQPYRKTFDWLSVAPGTETAAGVKIPPAPAPASFDKDRTHGPKNVPHPQPWLKPGEAPYHNDLGVALEDKGVYEEAAAAYARPSS